ncbi:hypothetical protein DFS34DRAFT_634742 [Phlyctochytrium arcticum]|nr:hypothetical protein DFS34DRAFT_634742 [Phlyctochytrium arcticum]
MDDARDMDDVNQTTVTSLNSIITVPQAALLSSPASSSSGAAAAASTSASASAAAATGSSHTSPERGRSREASNKVILHSAVGTPDVDAITPMTPTHLYVGEAATPPTTSSSSVIPPSAPSWRHYRSTRQRKIPLWQRFKRALTRCFPCVWIFRRKSANEHVRVKIRRDSRGRTVIKTRLIGKSSFQAFDDTDDEDGEDVWEEWTDQLVGPTGMDKTAGRQDTAVAGGLAEAAENVYDEVDNVMQVFAKVLEKLPKDLSDRYLFTGLLGYGGNGFVAEALDRLDGKTVAIKFISRDRVAIGSLINTEGYNYPIPVEAEIIRVVKHANIVAFHALYRDDTFYIIVMDRITNFLQQMDAKPASVHSRSNSSFEGIPPSNHGPPSRSATRPSSASQRRMGNMSRHSQQLSSDQSSRLSTATIQSEIPNPPLDAIPRPRSFSQKAPSAPPSICNGSTSTNPPPPLPIATAPFKSVALSETNLRLTLLSERPQPTLEQLKRPRHGHPGDLDEFLSVYGVVHVSIQRRFSRQLVDAYRQLSRCGFVYLDFRGENVIIDEACNARLVDFGMSQFIGVPNACFTGNPTSVGESVLARRSTTTSPSSNPLSPSSPHSTYPTPSQTPTKKQFTVYGTRLFSAPEILAGGAYRGPEADIWALGILLYMIASGGLEPFESVEEVLAGLVIFPDHVEPEQRNLIRRMLAVQPYLRATIDEIAAHPWLYKDD